mmetsp:Transcript_15670/g.17859  ORF Transcript_15670/g.17859 Transcript_15670/m.17859 type:complete len:89 (+) Transcript_15670:225-491(+)
MTTVIAVAAAVHSSNIKSTRTTRAEEVVAVVMRGSSRFIANRKNGSVDDSTIVNINRRGSISGSISSNSSSSRNKSHHHHRHSHHHDQ